MHPEVMGSFGGHERETRPAEEDQTSAWVLVLGLGGLSWLLSSSD